MYRSDQQVKVDTVSTIGRDGLQYVREEIVVVVSKMSPIGYHKSTLHFNNSTATVLYNELIC